MPRLSFRPRRREFPNPIKRAAYARSNGICECHRISGVEGLTPGGCGQPLGYANTFYEHVNPDGNGGSPTLENSAVLTKPCWRIKTRWDRRTVAKAARLFDMARSIRTNSSGRPLPGSRASGIRKRMNRQVETWG